MGFLPFISLAHALPLCYNLNFKTKAMKTKTIILGLLAFTGVEMWAQISTSFNANALGIVPNQNALFGNGALSSITTGIKNSAIGIDALFSLTTAQDNTAVGFKSLRFNTGSGNTAVGSNALINNTTADYNTGVGYNALFTNATGANNAAFGIASIGVSNNSINNSGFGAWTLRFTTTGQKNTATGAWCLTSNTTGSDNTASGNDALRSNTTGFDNTAIGSEAMFSNTTAYRNVAIGKEALYSSQTAVYNVAVGYAAMRDAQNGAYYNVGLGFQALYNSEAFSNTGVGANSLRNTTTGTENTGSGTNSLLQNITGDFNSGFGVNTLFTNMTGHNNTACGNRALFNTTESNNTAVGTWALFNNTTGTENTSIGYMSDIAGPFINATAIGANALTLANDMVVIGANIPGMTIGGYAPWSNLSDGRFKNSVQNNVPGLEFISKLRPVTYFVDVKKLDEHSMKNMPDSIRNARIGRVNYESMERKLQTGFIAQEVEATAKELNYEFDGVNAPKNDNDHYSISYSQFIMPLVKAVQELNEQKIQQDKKINDLLSTIEGLNAVIVDINNRSGSETGINNQNGNSSNLLESNVPNPFTHETVIKYNLPKGTKSAEMIVYDLSGKQIKSYPISEMQSSSITITAEQLTAGIYIYSILADGQILDSKRMVVTNK